MGDRIITPHQVDFRLGPNQGTGRGLDIHLAPSANPVVNSPAPGFGGINSLTLKRDVRMRLYPGQADMFPGISAPTPSPAAVANRPTVEAADNPPVDITCEAAFHFDVTRYVATFNKHVDVLRINPDGPSDQLNCEVLSIFFEPADVGTTATEFGGARQQPRQARAPPASRLGDARRHSLALRGYRPVAPGWNMTSRKTPATCGPGWLKATRADDPRPDDRSHLAAGAEIPSRRRRAMLS